MYGSPNFNSWMDRDLALGGKVIVKVGGKLEARLWRSKNGCLRIPNLAIHYGANRRGLPELEKEYKPIYATSLIDAVMTDDPGNAEKAPPALISKISEDLKVFPKDIIDFELNVFDA